ncbi:MAG: hypothetical protein WC365_01815 [Candidatus Babeliales bacterium]|jgi:hypothetical protein
MGKTARFEDLEHHCPDTEELTEKDWKHHKSGKDLRTRRSGDTIRKFFSRTHTIPTHNQSKVGRRKI